ncbi:RDD family protein [Thiorhodovibrio frisius]|uniref:Putative membrane protein n=1 Tax=Thiorhodovibrio frisius TaxID=631362 RepID=H8Z2T9_9GAMM|nr:RDD family protein [Thiorhodovibrio frisius]EIC21675.1 putative membrane protein [Thiorhodovibrio frisius]WPL21643.1 putative membrane protein [Thiorhodovibrio frisius]
MYCPECGTQLITKRKFCPSCGYPIINIDTTDGQITACPPIKSITAKEKLEVKKQPKVSGYAQTYLTPWKRIGAGIVDIFISLIVGFVLGLVFMLLLVQNSIDQNQLDSQLDGIGILVWWIYFAALESSSLQATFGKIAFGLKVTDLYGGQIGFWKASARHWGKLISTLTLFVGFLIMFFTKNKQSLHDLISNCLVIENAGRAN